MSTRQHTVILLVGILLVGSLAACGPTAQPTAVAPTSPPPTAAAKPTAVPATQPPQPTATPATGGDLLVAMQEDANLLNPYLGFNSTETFCIGLIYDTLLGYDLEQAELLPGLADSWEWDEDYMGVTFYLNPEAKWHDGEPVTADDVVFSFTYMAEQQFPIFFAIARNYGGIEKVDEHTVHIQFNYPQVDAPRFVGTVVSIIPEHIWKDIADGQSFANLDNPVGSGPFRLQERAGGQYLILEATGEHYRYNPSVDTITVQIVADETVAVLSLKQGDLDVLGWDVSPDVAADVLENPGDYPEIKVAQVKGLGTTTVMFNLRKPPYDNLEFRKALAQAINTQTIIEDVLLGFAEPVGPGLFPPAAARWYNDAIPLVEYDPEAAMAALDAAGFVDADGDGWRDQPDGTPINIQFVATTDPASQDVANYIAADLADVGIQVTLDLVDPMGLRPRLQAADFDAVLSGVSLSEPGMIAYYLGSDRGVIEDGQVVGFNYGGYASEEFDGVAQASRTAFDIAERQQLLYQAQEILARDMPQIPLYIPNILNLYSEAHFSGWVIEQGGGVINMDTLENLTRK